MLPLVTIQIVFKLNRFYITSEKHFIFTVRLRTWLNAKVIWDLLHVKRYAFTRRTKDRFTRVSYDLKTIFSPRYAGNLIIVTRYTMLWNRKYTEEKIRLDRNSLSYKYDTKRTFSYLVWIIVHTNYIRETQ